MPGRIAHFILFIFISVSIISCGDEEKNSADPSSQERPDIDKTSSISASVFQKYFKISNDKYVYILLVSLNKNSASISSLNKATLQRDSEVAKEITSSVFAGPLSEDLIQQIRSDFGSSVDENGLRSNMKNLYAVVIGEDPLPSGHLTLNMDFSLSDKSSVLVSDQVDLKNPAILALRKSAP